MTYNGIIAQQTVIFRGSSTISCLQQNPEFPNFRAITGAKYTVDVTGGVSGSFGVQVFGRVGDNSVAVAGLTTLAAGTFVLYPTTYSAAGAENDVETVKSIATNEIDQVLPPASVLFEAGGAANAIGISATITVSAVITSSR